MIVTHVCVCVLYSALVNDCFLLSDARHLGPAAHLPLGLGPLLQHHVRAPGGHPQPQAGQAHLWGPPDAGGTRAAAAPPPPVGTAVARRRHGRAPVALAAAAGQATGEMSV